MQRRSLIGGLLALAAPAIIRTPGLLMRVKAMPLMTLPSIKWVESEWDLGFTIAIGAEWRDANGKLCRHAAGFDLRDLVEYGGSMRDKAKARVMDHIRQHTAAYA